MEAAFVIYLPAETDLSAFSFHTFMFEWGGVQYPQGDPECYISPDFKLKKMKLHPPTGIGRMPADYQSVAAWQPIFIDGSGVDIYQSTLLGYMEEEGDVSLEKLLHRLLDDQPKWVVLFEPDFDQLDEWIPGDINTVLEKLKYSLTVEKTGYVIWKES